MLCEPLVPHQAPCVEEDLDLAKWGQCLGLQDPSPTDHGFRHRQSLVACWNELDRIPEPLKAVPHPCR